MLVVETIAQLRAELERYRVGHTIGFVPTMGALHPGHVSLIKQAAIASDFIVVSIFVNPLQFAPHEDLQVYPRPLEQDCQLCEELGVSLVFIPSVKELYPDQSTTQVIPPLEMMSGLCGRFRSGHFEGVATIVTKLLNIVAPDLAYFGEKDAQQLAIIRRLVTDLNIPVTIRGCPIVRDESGLAYSSRNQYLTPEEKQQALILSRSLQKAQTAFNQGERNADQLITLVKEELALKSEFKAQYVELVDPYTLESLTTIEKSGLLAIAGYLGSTRLIDNVILKTRKPIIAIDGPAGAGKSTVTRRIAQELGLLYLDTGAMYRAITWLVMQAGISFTDEGAHRKADQCVIASLAKEANIELIPHNSLSQPTRVLINGQDVTEAIRTPEVTAHVSTIAAQAGVRQELVKLQKLWGKKGGIVAEGRDIGSNVFPDAELKIFLTASVAERARRRLQDLNNQGVKDVDLTQLEQQIRLRDEQDSNRAIAPLKKAPDAIALHTDNLTIEQVTAKIVSIFRLTN